MKCIKLTFELIAEFFNFTNHDTSFPVQNGVAIGIRELEHIAKCIAQLNTLSAINPRPRYVKPDDWFADLVDMWLNGRLQKNIARILKRNLRLVGNTSFKLPAMEEDLHTYWYPRQK